MDNVNKPQEFKTQEEQDDMSFPSKDYNKKIFSFSTQELTELQPLEDVTKLVQTQLSIGQIAQRAKDSYVGGQVLNRLGVKKSPDSKFNYDLEQKKVIVYEPRLWCSICDVKRAEFKYQDKIFCKDDIETVKKDIAKPIEKEEKPARKPKKEVKKSVK